MYNNHNPLTLDYTMDGVTLKPVSQHPYIGAELQRDQKWKTHIDNITSDANRTIRLIKRNLNRCSQDVKAKAYTTLVRPTLEYSSTVWDPYRKCQIEYIQRRAARFILHDYSRESSVTRMLTILNWCPWGDHGIIYRMVLPVNDVHVEFLKWRRLSTGT